jgi:hypothetical protein
VRTILLHQARVLPIQLSVSQGVEAEHGGATAYGPSEHLPICSIENW